MNTVVLKLVLTPTVIAMATLVARRWGPVAGGWVVGLPLTAGPVSVFLAVEQGRGFAAEAARGAMLGAVGLAVFSLVYSRAAAKLAWPAAVATSLAAYFAATAAISFITLPPLPAALLTGALIFGMLSLEGSATAKTTAAPSPWWDLPLRIVTATTVVMVITAASSFLGPALSGLFSAFPILICLMSAFTHKMSGPANAIQLSRGVTSGAFSFAAFFLAVALSVEHTHLFFAYLLAVATASAVNAAVLLLGARKAKRAAPSDSQ